MCACEPGFTCTRCVGTPFDPAYLDNAPEPVTPELFDDFTREKHYPILSWGDDE